MKSAIVVIALLAIVLLLSGCCSMNKGGSGCADCDQIASTGTGWCEECGEGAVNGDEIGCQGCYVARTGGPACPTCSK